MDFNFDTGTISSILELDSGANNLTVLGSAGLVIPVGGNAGRINQTGALRFNSASGLLEWFDGSAWVSATSLNANLTGLAGLSGAGFVTHTGPGTFTERFILPVAGQTSVTNQGGVAGNVTVGLANVGTSGTYVSVTTDEFGRVTAGNTTQSWSTITGTPTTLSGYGITDAYTMAQTANLTWGWSSITSTPTTLSGYGITDAATATDLSNHIGDYSLHLTTAQNAWIDNVTVTSTEVNYLTGVTANVQTQFGEKLSLTGGTMTGNIVMSSGTHITVNTAPVDATDAVNKNYVDNLLSGLSWKQAVDSVGSANPGTATTGDRFLNLTDGKIYTATATNTWDAGATPADGWTVFDKVTETGYVYDGAAWTQFTGAGQIAAGVGLSKSGNQIDVNLGAGIAQLPSDEVGIDLYTSGGLWLTVDGLSPSTSNVAAVGVRTDGNSIVASAAGIKVAANGIGIVELSSSVAGTGLTGGSGNALSLATVGNIGTYNNVTTDAYGRVTSGSTVAYLTQNENITITGAVTGSGTTNIATTLANVGTAGTYATVTTNDKGLVTSGNATLLWSSVAGTPTTLSGYGITDAVLNNGSAPSIQSGIEANMPAAGTVGALYVTSDTNAIFRDSGTAWVSVGESAVLYTENVVSPTLSTVTGNNAVTIGSGNTASGTNVMATGEGAKSNLAGAEVRANGSFTAAGDAQTGKYVLRNITTDATPTEVFLDGASARIVLPNNSAMTYQALVVARRTDASGNEAAFKIEGLISRNATAGTTALIGSRSKTILTRPTGWDVEVSANVTAGALTFTVTGANAQTVRWVVTVVTSEVAN